MNGRIITMLAAMVAITACGPSGDDGRAVAPAAFVPPVTQAPDPVAGQAHGVPLTAYVGHNARDAVDGVSFFDRTEVANALIDAVPEAALRHRIVAETTRTPIFASDGRVGVHGCEAQRCDSHDWTVFVAVDGNADHVSVCYHDAATMGAASRWTTRAGTGRRPGACPSA